MWRYQNYFSFLDFLKLNYWINILEKCEKRYISSENNKSLLFCCVIYLCIKHSKSSISSSIPPSSQLLRLLHTKHHSVAARGGCNWDDIMVFSIHSVSVLCWLRCGVCVCVCVELLFRADDCSDTLVHLDNDLFCYFLQDAGCRQSTAEIASHVIHKQSGLEQPGRWFLLCAAACGYVKSCSCGNLVTLRFRCCCASTFFKEAGLIGNPT